MMKRDGAKGARPPAMHPAIASLAMLVSNPAFDVDDVEVLEEQVRAIERYISLVQESEHVEQQVRAKRRQAKQRPRADAGDQQPDEALRKVFESSKLRPGIDRMDPWTHTALTTQRQRYLSDPGIRVSPEKDGYNSNGGYCKRQQVESSQSTRRPAATRRGQRPQQGQVRTGSASPTQPVAIIFCTRRHRTLRFRNRSSSYAARSAHLQCFQEKKNRGPTQMSS